MDQALSLPITLIVAPACYGKTTSVGLWIKENLKCVGWLSLDTQDNEYIRFWSHLIASLEVVLPGVTEKCSHILDKGYQDSFSLIKTLIEHMQLVKKTVVFVLDDLHLIYRNDILESLTWLIEYLPHHVHVLITARTEPPLPIVKWRARGHILQLGVHDLQFKKEETRVFFHECANLHLTDQEIEILVSKTEGWIGGMNLIALSMTEKIDFSKRIHQVNGLHRDISDFLFNEVFQLLPDELQLFLLQTSLLKNMNSSLCDTITGRSDSQSILEKLEKMNLFITPLDDNRSWYRFHMLFSEFLRNHFAYKYPEKASEIYQAAGRWMEKSNSFEEAVDYYLAGEHFLDASRLIEELMPLLYQGRYHLLAGWIKELPERYLLDRSSLHLISTSLIIEQEGVQKADKYLENVSEHYQTIKCTLSRENINEYQFQLLGCRGLVSLFKGEADKFLQLVEEKIERFDQRAFEFLGILYDDREIKVTASPNDSLKEVMDFISRFIEIEERSAYCKETPHLGTLYTYWADMKYKCNELDEAQVLEKLVQLMVGLISRVDRLPISPGEPEFPIHLSSLGDISHPLTQIKHATQGRSISGGMDGAGGSTDVAESRIRSMAEGLERYSSCTYDERQFIWATADELGDDALDLRKVPVCSDAELRHPKCGVINLVTDAPIRWVKGISLLEQREVWVPAIMTYLHLSAESMGERFWLPISTGCAAHVSIEEALISAICEVIERDAISLTWLQQLPLPHIEFDEMELGSKTMP